MWYSRCLLIGMLTTNLVASPLAINISQADCGWSGRCCTTSYVVSCCKVSCCKTSCPSNCAMDCCQQGCCEDSCCEGDAANHEQPDSVPSTGDQVPTVANESMVPQSNATPTITEDTGGIDSPTTTKVDNQVTTNYATPQAETAVDPSPAPVEEQAVTIPEETDDLFAPIETTAPEEESAEESAEEVSDETDDLFGSFDTEAPVDESDEDSSSSEADAVFDLEESDTTEADSTETESTEEDESDSSELDDLFGQRGALDILTQNGGLESELVRVWTDDTGRYQCEARLLTTHSNGIVLIKPNGYQAVVPLVRLSDGDLQFVRQQVNAKREMLAQQATTKRFAAN